MAPRYRSRISVLLADRDTYDLADQARERIGTDSARALRLIDQAIDRQPRESLFHGIRGDALASDGRHGEAIRSYGAAIERNPGYFGHYLGRGMSHDALGETGLARADLERSNGLLSTPFASYKLGGYALADGERAKAKRLFKVASEAAAAIDRVVHHAVILELDVPSYRAEAARKRLGTNQERGD